MSTEPDIPHKALNPPKLTVNALFDEGLLRPISVNYETQGHATSQMLAPGERLLIGPDITLVYHAQPWVHRGDVRASVTVHRYST